MKLPNNGGNISPTRYFMPCSKSFSVCNGLHFVMSLDKGHSMEPSTSRATAMPINCTPPINSKVLLLKKIHISSNTERLSWGLIREFTPTD